MPRSRSRPDLSASPRFGVQLGISKVVELFMVTERHFCYPHQLADRAGLGVVVYPFLVVEIPTRPFFAEALIRYSLAVLQERSPS